MPECPGCKKNFDMLGLYCTNCGHRFKKPSDSKRLLGIIEKLAIIAREEKETIKMASDLCKGSTTHRIFRKKGVKYCILCGKFLQGP